MARSRSDQDPQSTTDDSGEEQMQMLAIPNVLLLDSEQTATGAVIEILAQHANLTLVRNLTEIKERSVENEYDALFCGSSFHQGRWKDSVQAIRIIVGGNLPVIFLSRTAGEKEWMEMFESGGFDLLAFPYHKSQTLAALSQAVESHQARVAQHRSLR